ncbi:MAG: NAD(P)/FAD-dependent oxidoreductase [Ignavibacteriales bacterium]|nr:NAD(P)/FAD-dependent oxidoreductase [Ignavibacteriales bacterium]
MKKILILGAGFGGLTLASELDILAKEKKTGVTLIDKSPTFSMGFSTQWAMMGRRTVDEGTRSYSSLKAKYVQFVCEEIIAINAKENFVQTTSQTLSYDYLVLALGAELAPERIHGLSECSYNLCDANSVLQLKSALHTITEGTIGICISSVPFKCPPAPYEYAFLIDDLLSKRGVRKNIRIVVTTPEPQPMPVAGKIVGEQVVQMLRERRIEYFPLHKPMKFDSAQKKIHFENNAEISFDILGAMFPHQSPKVVRDAGLTDASGFVFTDVHTMKTSVENIFAVGDCAMFKLPNGNPHPKAGVFAEEQAKVVAKNILAEFNGESRANYEGRGTCFIDAGNEQAASAEAYLLSPEGPKFTLHPPSSDGIEGKKLFERTRFQNWFGE